MTGSFILDKPVDHDPAMFRVEVFLRVLSGSPTMAFGRASSRPRVVVDVFFVEPALLHCRSTGRIIQKVSHGLYHSHNNVLAVTKIIRLILAFQTANRQWRRWASSLGKVYQCNWKPHCAGKQERFQGRCPGDPPSTWILNSSSDSLQLASVEDRVQRLSKFLLVKIAEIVKLLFAVHRRGSFMVPCSRRVRSGCISSGSVRGGSCNFTGVG